ncbi:MAG: DUF2905 domain-containing protein [Firmicutes bacterium]|nr:DUF2905 domain-containing protein [Bacillota bacterium]MBO2520566.1 DUF2905 domain-containing protein [Bacillota bacterium]
MTEFGRTLIILGLVLAGFGLVITVAGRVPFLGRLPGDIYIKREGFVFYFPLATSLVISLILTLIFTLFRR